MSSPQLHEIHNLEGLIRNYEQARNAWGQIVRTAANALMNTHRTAERIARNLGLRRENAFNNFGLPNAQIRQHPNYNRSHKNWMNARRRQNRDVGGHRARMLNTQRRLNRTFGPGNLRTHINRWRRVVKPFVQNFVRSYPGFTNKEVGFILTRKALSELR
jgi:hypothetical protein